MAADLVRARIREETRAALATAARRSWPVENCVVFTADIYMAAGLPDLIAAYRGRYRTTEEAHALVGRFGLAGFMARIARKHGFRRIEPLEAEDGDWGINGTENGPSAVIRYAGLWVGSRIGGYAVSDDRRMIAAWKVA